MTQKILLSSALACFAFPASAATLSDTFTSFYVLGDSNSDFGNLGPDGPPPPYFNSQFSNGPVWADILDDQFETGDPDDIRTWNYAFGGAKVTETSDVPDLPTQLSVFAADLDPSAPDPLPGTPELGERPLVALWFGANDIRSIYTEYLEARDAAELLGGAAADAAIAAAQESARTAATETGALFGASIGLVAAAPQINDILTFTTADAGATPEYDDPIDNALLSELSMLYNGALGAELEAIKSGGTNVYTVDIFQLQQDVAAAPGAFGFTNVTDPCLTFDPSGAPLICDAPESYLFWDEIGHLSGAAHAALAGIVEGQVTAEVAAQGGLTPVPLPAAAPALGLGIALLGGLSWRKKRRASDV
ncbi:MAG: SGNH/GDSL hydrolase family protein [Pseudomonadota bacterium]